MKHTTKALPNSLSTSRLPSEDGYKGMKHECFSSFSFYVKLTSSQQRIMPKDVMHTTKRKKKTHFLKIVPNFRFVYKIAKKFKRGAPQQHQHVGYLQLLRLIFFFFFFRIPDQKRCFIFKNTNTNKQRGKKNKQKAKIHGVFEDAICSLAM